MLHLISFGSGSSGNCSMLFTDNDAMLIDAGVGVRGLKKSCIDYGLSLNAIHNIIVTHDHADHIKSAGSISSTYKVPVYSTAKVHDGIFRNWVVKKKIEGNYIRYIEKGESKQIGDFHVTAFNVPHDSTDNVGYMIEAEGVTLAWITDCGHITDEIRSVIAKSDYLVIEANHDLEMLSKGPYPSFLKARISSNNGHLSNNDCGEAIAECATSRLHHVWLCHLSDKNNTPELALNTVREIVHNKADILSSLPIDALDRKKPTGIFDLTL